MNHVYTIEISNAEHIALHYVAVDGDAWIKNAAHERCRLAMDEIIQIAVAKCLEIGLQIPGTREEIVELAFAQGWVKSAADRNAEITAAAEAAAQ